MLTSRSDSNFERSNISLKETKPDVVDWNSNGLDYCVRNNEGKFDDFRQTDLAKECCVQKLFHCLIQIKEPCVPKYEGLTRSEILGIFCRLRPIFTMSETEYHGGISNFQLLLDGRGLT